MPTYQYACSSCGERLEVVQKFTDEPLTECPVCDGALRKVFSPVGVVFKGSGFYKTDSRSTRGSAGTADKPPKSDAAASKTSADSGGTSTAPATTAAAGTDSASGSTGKAAEVA